ncbi:MAG: phosphomannomutase/phosphoglucomutase [Candidatus Komeilibacteria bacterium CG_4_10_14_0_2_um_filter_37_10]|uniref:Phosphomannomutase/phosphoglucomutase n=1 Tax=Candidatus Komeilibacteria bacterium CG_4_10_14_0_2_um_filter_37_10 TaxID=1974470 RepID=A0A2M7VDN6_9BACT|nr:MAG: phosphomannomutase/phosphoglucomutase [Candidatus Komeilibacteria bacterium CG_4_10_14_0_2_um_filter_37_10]
MSDIFKSYDIRGLYPQQINRAVANLLGQAIAKFFLQAGQTKTVVIGGDMRMSTPELRDGIILGLVAQGMKVWDLGLVSTDTVYYASGRYSMPGIMITASHNPAEYNGCKIVLAGAVGVGSDSGLPMIEQYYLALQEDYNSEHSLAVEDKRQILTEYLDYLKRFINPADFQKMRLVIDAGNGLAGKIIPLLLENSPLDIIPLYFELDGSFPNHEANPLKPENTSDLIKRVKLENADLGLAFDGDSDRVFFIDEQGRLIDSSYIICLVAQYLLNKYPAQKILYNAVCSRVVPEVISGFGGQPVMERVGHTFIKNKMRQEDIIFGGEKSGHYYYRDCFYADNAFLTVLIVLSIMTQESGKTFSQLIEKFQTSSILPETNFTVDDQKKIITKLKNIYHDGEQSELDGLSVYYPEWWFNVRLSGTEPLLRLNLEAADDNLLQKKLAELSQLIME